MPYCLNSSNTNTSHTKQFDINVISQIVSEQKHIHTLVVVRRTNERNEKRKKKNRMNNNKK